MNDADLQRTSEVRSAWSMRELRALTGEFLRHNPDAIQPVQLGRGGGSGYLVGEDALKRVLGAALAGLRGSIDTDPASATLLMARLSDLLAEGFAAQGVEISGDDIIVEGLPRTSGGAIDIVALAERCIPAPRRPHEELDWGAPPRAADLDWLSGRPATTRRA